MVTYKRKRFLPDMVNYAVWLYYRDLRVSVFAE